MILVRSYVVLEAVALSDLSVCQIMKKQTAWQSNKQPTLQADRQLVQQMRLLALAMIYRNAEFSRS